MRNTFAGCLFEFAKERKEVILIVGDLGYNVFNKFGEELPNQFINAGICEQNMASMAAGIALEGKTVFTYSIANFPTLRAYEQIRNDICYHEANVKIVAVGAGFAYGALGMSHHATEDIAAMRALPNMEIFCPCDPIEARLATEYLCKSKKPSYLRLGKGGEPLIHKTGHFDITKIHEVAVSDKNNVIIFATGAIIDEAIKAREELKQKSYSFDIVSVPCIKPLDRDYVMVALKRYKRIITLEEHNIIGGLGSSIAEIMAEYGSGKKLIRIGINDCYSSVAGSQNFLRGKYNIGCQRIIEEIINE